MPSFRCFCRWTLVVVPAVSSLSCSDGQPSEFSVDQEPARQAIAAAPAIAGFKDVCPPRGAGTMRCHAKIAVDASGDVVVNAGPVRGLLPADLRAAYNLPSAGGNHRVVAIVDGFDSPTAEDDMNIYRAQFGIAPCTTANGCFKKVNTAGQAGPYPPADPDWAIEIAVDLDMVSAMCPDCYILLVEAATGFAVDLGPAVRTAAQVGVFAPGQRAFAINNSYGEPEDDATSKMVENDYNQPGVFVVASSGDDGYGASTEDNGMVVQQNANPANLPWVLSVGGTTLTKAVGSARGWNETVWAGAGSGCSSHMPKPAWQKDTGCARRTISDISAVADPNAPSYGAAFVHSGVWGSVGGTSISSPIIAGIFSLFGISSNSWPYEHPSSFFDITSGSNSRNMTACSNYLCVAGVGYDGPTGFGTPNGSLFPSVALDAGTSDTGAGTGGASGTGGAGQGGGTATGSGVAGGAGDSTSSGAGGAATAGSSGTGTTTSGAAGSAGGTTTATGGAGPAVPKASEGSGCSCRLGSSSRTYEPVWTSVLAFAAAGLVASRRRAPKASRRTF